MRMLAAALAGLFVAMSGPASAAGALPAAVDAAAADFMAKQHVPGVAIAVVEHGSIVYAKGYGLADVASGAPVTADTRFEIGSITKQFSAACVMQLVEAGKLSLDDRLATYVPEYAPGAAVTVRQLLSHTSGIPEYLDGPDVVHAAGTTPGTLATILARIAGKPLTFTPGTKWAYSNTNYILIGRIIELAAHDSYEHYVRAHIFAPAGMTASGFIDDAAPPRSLGYANGAHGVAGAPPLRGDWAFAAGAIVSTVGDIAKWNAALLAGTIVPLADVATMRTAVNLANGTSAGYGFGWLTDALGTHPRVWHNGGTFGFSSVNDTYPADGQAIVVLANLAEANPQVAATAIFTALHPEVVATLGAPVAGEDPAITARVREWLRRFETGDVDRSQLSAAMATALTPQLIAGSKESFAPLGEPATLVYRGRVAAAGQTVYTYLATFAAGTARITMAIDADGRISGYRLSGAE